MCIIVAMSKRCLPFAALLCSLVGCHTEPPFWKDVVTQQALVFLVSHGVSAKRLVVNNAGGFELDLRGTTTTNLHMLEGMPLEILLLSGTSVRELTPLREMRYLRKLDIAGTAVADLSPLEDLQIDELRISQTEVSDLHPIRNMPLLVLSMVHTKVSDLTPIQAMPLEEIYFSADASLAEQSIHILREKTSLRCINYYGRVNEFWADYDAGKFRNRPLPSHQP